MLGSATLEQHMPLAASAMANQEEPRIRPWVERHAVLLVLALALFARLYAVTAPLTDGGHERQTQVAMIARNLYRDGMNILYPRMDTFAPDPGYVLLEFPLQPALMALVYYVTGVKDIVGRLIVVAFSTASILAMYGVARVFLRRRAAIFATALYALTPMSIYFGRAVFPEALWLCFGLGALYFVLRWNESGRWVHWGGGCLCAALTCLEKAPPGLVLMLPLAAVWWLRWRTDTLRRPHFWAFFILSLLPIAAWALWSKGLSYTAANEVAGFSPYQLASVERWGIPQYWVAPRFYYMVVGSLVTVGLTPIGSVLAADGVTLVRRHPLSLVVYAWLVGMALYVLLTPGAQATHWNYHVPLIPLGALLAGFAVEAGAWTERMRQSIAWSGRRRARTAAVATALVVTHVLLYGVVARLVYALDRRVPVAIEAGLQAQRSLPSNGFVVLVEPGIVPATQSYYMDRRIKDVREFQFIKKESDAAEWIEAVRAQGAVGIMAVDTPYGSGTTALRAAPGMIAYLESRYRLVAEAPRYLIYSFSRE